MTTNDIVFLSIMLLCLLCTLYALYQMFYIDRDDNVNETGEMQYEKFNYKFRGDE